MNVQVEVRWSDERWQVIYSDPSQRTVVGTEQTEEEAHLFARGFCAGLAAEDADRKIELISTDKTGRYSDGDSFGHDPEGRG